MRASKSDHTVSSMEIEDSSNGYAPLMEERMSKAFSGVRQRPVRVAAACLAVLCVLLLLAIIGQAVHSRNIAKDDELKQKTLSTVQMKLQQAVSDAALQKKGLTASQAQLQEECNYLTSQKKQLQTNNDILQREAETLRAGQSKQQADTSALTKERDQLKASESQLQSSNADLTKANDFLKKSYESQSQKVTEMQRTTGELERRRDELQDQNALLKHVSEQLRYNFTALLTMVKNLRFSQDISAQEKEKMRSSHDVVLEQRDQLNTSLLVLEATTRQIQDGYTAVTRERDELQAATANLTTARDLLVAQNQNLTAERDLLLAQGGSPAAGCPYGWQTHEQSCYYASTIEKTWEDSRLYCVQQGANLIMVTDSAEMSFLNSIVELGGEVWIGLTDNGKEGQWMWVDGTRMTTSFWAKGQPNQHLAIDQDCVEFWSSSSTHGSWNDEACSIKAKWVCKK
ncbi:C-type lectin domain family 10 member A [Gadus morhua]|uniref:C-type lectin domain family 10 member A n=1 Tax=Gadus morhua TaxID=8049 RepID=UPI0011B641AC|nr:C-type lectin domain family 10 member A-like [Gadus morhua]